MASEAVVTLTEANFEAEISSSTVPVIVDFWAEWCGPCRMLGPILDDLAKEQAGKVKIGKLNTDEQIDTAAKFGIRSIPTLLVFKGGEVVSQVVLLILTSEVPVQLPAVTDLYLLWMEFH